MNVIKWDKALVCLPPRQATRAIGSFFCNYFEMVDLKTGEHRPTHNAQIPAGMEDYLLIMTTRNPYERYLSIISWQQKIGQWAGNAKELATKMGDYYQDHLRLKDRVDHWIRVESIADDLKQISFVHERLHELENEVDSFNWINPYKSVGRSVAELHKYYDIIYKNTQWVFEMFDYDKDSYLTIKS